MVEILTTPIVVMPRAGHREAERAAIAALVRQRFGFDAELAHTPDGAPYLPGREEHISVSHCTDLAVLGISDSPVGIDIDTRRPQLARVASRFLTPAERDSIQDSWEIELLLHYWTAKEAVFKCAGIPSLVISEIEIADLKFSPGSDCCASATATARGHRFTLTFRTPTPRHLLAISRKIED